jgi:hypothetical protein
MTPNELREYLKSNLGYAEEEVLKLKLKMMRSLVAADMGV